MRTLLQELKQQGIKIKLVGGGKIRLESNEPIPPELVERLKAHKHELIEALSPPSLTPDLERRLRLWGCENCQMFLEGGLFCFVPGAQSQVVNVRFLRGCPQKDKEILKAIQAGRHLDWMI